MKIPQLVLRQARDDARSQAHERYAGGYVQLRAAGALFKNVPIHDAGNDAAAKAAA